MNILNAIVMSDENVSIVNFSIIDKNGEIIRFTMCANSVLIEYNSLELYEVITQPGVNNEEYKIRVGMCGKKILYLAKNTNIPIDDLDDFYKDFTEALDSYLNNGTTKTSIPTFNPPT